jgi:hypothetical protein
LPSAATINSAVKSPPLLWGSRLSDPSRRAATARAAVNHLRRVCLSSALTPMYGPVSPMAHDDRAEARPNTQAFMPRSVTSHTVRYKGMANSIAVLPKS